MAVLVIGTGFLGEAICDELHKCGKSVIPTHHTHKKYADSLPYDFFHDDPEKVFVGKDITTVVIPAKIEFIEDSSALAQAMKRLLTYFKQARVVYISSDGVFDGQDGNYTETDAPQPVTLYGRNLALCEALVGTHPDHCIIRPSYLYGFVHGVLDDRLRSAKEALEQDEVVSRFTDMYKSPLSYLEAAQIIVVLTLSSFQGIVHISGERLSVYDFTRVGMLALGIPTEKLVPTTMPMPKPADMLADTSLDNALMQKLTHIEPLSISENLGLPRERQSKI